VVSVDFPSIKKSTYSLCEGEKPRNSKSNIYIEKFLTNADKLYILIDIRLTNKEQERPSMCKLLLDNVILSIDTAFYFCTLFRLPRLRLLPVYPMLI